MVGIITLIIINSFLPAQRYSKATRAEAFEYASEIIARSSEKGVDPLLATLVAKKESSFQKNARGKRGEIGLFQIIPRGVASKGATTDQLKNQKINILLGISSLAEGMKLCNTREEWKIAEFHHTGKCIHNPTPYGLWIMKQYSHYRELVQVP